MSYHGEFDIKDVNATADLIFFLDGYRAGRHVEIEWMDDRVKEGRLGFEFWKQWSETKAYLMRMAALPPGLEYLERWAKWQAYLRFLGYFTLSTVLLLAGVGFFLVAGRVAGGIAFITAFLTYAAIPYLAIMLLTLIGPPILGRMIFRRLRQYRQRNSQTFAEADAFLKRTVQQLIYSLTNRVLMAGVERDERYLPPTAVEGFDITFKQLVKRLGKRQEKDQFSFDLFNVDYNGVLVLRAPGLLRRHFTVSLAHAL